MSTKILSVKNLTFMYKNPNINDPDKWIEIFKDINMSINKGDIIGIAGKSGCGKTTLTKAIVNYFYLSGNKINKDYKINGDITYYDSSKHYSTLDQHYRSINPPPIQMVFQDPRTSLNMKMKLYDQLKESILLNKKVDVKDIDEQILYYSKKFKIDSHLESTPENLSGGQRRRFGLAKIICCNPKLIIADEPVSSLDVSIKNDIMNVLYNLLKENITLIVISHDISLLKKTANYIYVMDKGEIVEKWNPSTVPEHDITKKLNDDSVFVNKHINI